MELTPEVLSFLNGIAGLAALVNSLLMWPTIRYLKRLEPRVEALEKRELARKPTKKKKTRKRGSI